jgi:DNA-binding XRE family transcriptional regulator
MNRNRIQELREKQGLTQVELARRAKMASTNLCNIENGRLEAGEKQKEPLQRD